VLSTIGRGGRGNIEGEGGGPKVERRERGGGFGSLNLAGGGGKKREKKELVEGGYVDQRDGWGEPCRGMVRGERGEPSVNTWHRSPKGQIDKGGG